MNSVGVFREEEIDGRPFHIYNFLSQTKIPTSGEAAIIDSGGGDNDDVPLFFCPTLRLKVAKSKRKENCYSNDEDDDEDEEDEEEEEDDKNKVLLLDVFPHFPNIRNANEQVQDFLDSCSGGNICKFPVVPLFWCNEGPDHNEEYSSQCPACECKEFGTGYYLCVTCDQKFHKECVESPLEIKHPTYPFASLRLYTPLTSLNYRWKCIFCEEWLYDMLYHCPTYNLSMHPVCAMKPIPIVVDHPKRHPHSLTFFPKQDSLACNVCGVIKEFIPTYICARCVFVVHQDCIYFPYVIRISRHHHRISFTSSLPSGETLSCGVCRQKVDNSCGAYSCNKCDDHRYFVHSRCALRGDLWDGEELEGVPEVPEIVVEPFERIADGIILHFSHGHHLKLEISRVYDDEKLCQACVLPIYEGNHYSCMDHCDFILHEACASSPLKKHHPLHAHSLTLEIVANGYNDTKGLFYCDACRRYSCGFDYEDFVGSFFGFRLDIRCASISEPFEYQGHEHPLFLALSPEEEELAICQICQEDGDEDNQCKKLNCIECDYVICFRCATLPYKARYKHDKHFLTFTKVKEANDQSGWCEVCERKIVYSQKGGFYACDDGCCTTLHVHCLLGKDPYMKPGQTITVIQGDALVLRNNTMTRPFCHNHEVRCPGKLVFQYSETINFVLCHV